VDEEVLDFLGDVEVGILGRVIGARNGTIFIISLFLAAERARFSSCGQVFLRLRLLLLRGHDVLFFSGIDVVVFIVVNFEGHVEVLVLDFVLTWLARRGFGRLTGRLAVVVGVGAALLVVWLVVFFFREFVVLDLQGVASRLRKVVFL